MSSNLILTCDSVSGGYTLAFPHIRPKPLLSPLSECASAAVLNPSAAPSRLTTVHHFIIRDTAVSIRFFESAF